MRTRTDLKIPRSVKLPGLSMGGSLLVVGCRLLLFKTLQDSLSSPADKTEVLHSRFLILGSGIASQAAQN